MAKSTKTEAPAETPAAAPEFTSYNRVQLAGRLTADPELRYTPSGKAVAHLRVATNDTKVAEFHDVVAWEQIAEATEGLTKGTPVLIEGRLQTRTWETQDGSKRRTTEIVASSVAKPAS
jgi:single-strand DNA-binding protein